MKIRRIRAGTSRWVISIQNLVFLALIGGLAFLGIVSLTRRVADPASIKINKPIESEDLLKEQSKAEDMRLMLASHGRLLWYFPGNESTKVLHEGQVGASD
jgi:hypothetical protein